jgi:hypothetical protein
MNLKINHFIYLLLVTMFMQACDLSKKSSIESLQECNTLSSAKISIQNITALQTVRLNDGARPMTASVISAEKISLDTSPLISLTHISEYKKNAKWFTNSSQSDDIHQWLVKELTSVYMVPISEKEVALIGDAHDCKKMILMELVLEK